MNAAALAGVRLKPTTTRVRTRDGRILEEKRNDDTGTFSAVQVAVESEKPQYVLDQEKGISRLSFKVFNAAEQRWLPAASGPKAAAGDELGGLLKLVTYNVWFSKFHAHKRARALFDIVQKEEADVLCLQEVTPNFLGWLRDEPWIQQDYMLSDAVGTTLRGTFAYGVVMLVRRDGRFLPDLEAADGLILHSMPSGMNRCALVARGQVPGTGRVVIATAHLESMTRVRFREQQLEQIFTELESHCDSSEPALLILAGDMNHEETSPFESAVVSKHGFSDAWNRWAPSASGFDAKEQGCTMPDGRRIDRVFFRVHTPEAAPDVESVAIGSMKRLGTETIAALESDEEPEFDGEEPCETTSELRPSDHYGVCCIFRSSASTA